MAALNLNIDEAIRLADERRGSVSGVVSDILIAPADLTAADFAQMLATGGPVGYEPFRNYIDGDYQYSNAIFKTVMVANGGSTPRLLGMTLGVDVPDIFDRGSVNTSAAGVVHVPFNRTFNVVAEVVATLKGGVVIAMPRVTNVTKDGFDVELVAPDNARVAGAVSWSAKGY